VAIANAREGRAAQRGWCVPAPPTSAGDPSTCTRSTMQAEKDKAGGTAGGGSSSAAGGASGGGGRRSDDPMHSAAMGRGALDDDGGWGGGWGERAGQTGQGALLHTHTHTHTIIERAPPAPALKIMERMVNQNARTRLVADFRYWEDASDQFRDNLGTWWGRGGGGVQGGWIVVVVGGRGPFV